MGWASCSPHPATSRGSSEIGLPAGSPSSPSELTVMETSPRSPDGPPPTGTQAPGRPLPTCRSPGSADQPISEAATRWLLWAGFPAAPGPRAAQTAGRPGPWAGPLGQDGFNRSHLRDSPAGTCPPCLCPRTPSSELPGPGPDLAWVPPPSGRHAGAALRREAPKEGGVLAPRPGGSGYACVCTCALARLHSRVRGRIRTLSSAHRLRAWPPSQVAPGPLPRRPRQTDVPPRTEFPDATFAFLAAGL